MGRYQTLQTIYIAVKDFSQPSSYRCSPADIILHHNLPWDTIITHIRELEKEGMTSVQQSAAGIVFTITDAGIAKVLSAGN